jgi:hypothetical protein
MPRPGVLELLLAEIAAYLILWLLNDYLATLLSLVFGVIFLVILIATSIVELIEPSRVPRWYFKLMIVSVLAPLIAALVYFLMGHSLDWPAI